MVFQNAIFCISFPVDCCKVALIFEFSLRRLSTYYFYYHSWSTHTICRYPTVLPGLSGQRTHAVAVRILLTAAKKALTSSPSRWPARTLSTTGYIVAHTEVLVGGVVQTNTSDTNHSDGLEPTATAMAVLVMQKERKMKRRKRRRRSLSGPPLRSSFVRTLRNCLLDSFRIVLMYCESN